MTTPVRLPDARIDTSSMQNTEAPLTPGKVRTPSTDSSGTSTVTTTGDGYVTGGSASTRTATAPVPNPMSPTPTNPGMTRRTTGGTGVKVGSPQTTGSASGQGPVSALTPQLRGERLERVADLLRNAPGWTPAPDGQYRMDDQTLALVRRLYAEQFPGEPPLGRGWAFEVSRLAQPHGESLVVQNALRDAGIHRFKRNPQEQPRDAATRVLREAGVSPGDPRYAALFTLLESAMTPHTRPGSVGHGPTERAGGDSQTTGAGTTPTGTTSGPSTGSPPTGSTPPTSPAVGAPAGDAPGPTADPLDAIGDPIGDDDLGSEEFDVDDLEDMEKVVSGLSKESRSSVTSTLLGFDAREWLSEQRRKPGSKNDRGDALHGTRSPTSGARASMRDVLKKGERVHEDGRRQHQVSAQLESRDREEVRAFEAGIAEQRLAASAAEGTHALDGSRTSTPVKPRRKP